MALLPLKVSTPFLRLESEQDNKVGCPSNSAKNLVYPLLRAINCYRDGPFKKRRKNTLKKVNHIGIAVRNIDSAIELWRRVFGVRVDEAIVAGDMIVAMAHVGDVLVELLAPASESSVIGKFLRETR